ncbi:MAG: hypothetical protein R2882_10595 [Gemmatimonadales bacterium]
MAEAEPLVALRHACLIDGTGAPVRENQTIVIRDGRIAAVGDDAIVVASAEAWVHDLAGATVLRAWTYGHQHFCTSAYFTQMAVKSDPASLGLGVTNVCTAGGAAPVRRSTPSATSTGAGRRVPGCSYAVPRGLPVRGSGTTGASSPRIARWVVASFYWA